MHTHVRMSNTTVFPLSPLNNHRNSAPVNLGGYDCNFIEDPPDELVCQICTLVAQHPYQSTCCGRVYCKRCIEEYRRKQEELTGDRKFNCPNCRRRANTFHDKRGSRNIKCLKVKCTNLEFGCEWEGELLNLDNHVSTKCPHSRVQCPNRYVQYQYVAMAMWYHGMRYCIASVLHIHLYNYVSMAIQEV